MIVTQAWIDLVGSAPAGYEWMQYFFVCCVVLILLRCFVAVFFGLMDFLFGRK